MNLLQGCLISLARDDCVCGILVLDELRDDVAYAVEEELSISKWSDCSATFAAAESCSVWDEVLVGWV